MSRLAGAGLAMAVAALSPSLYGQAQQQFPVPTAAGMTGAPVQQLSLPPLPAATPITPNGEVVEDVVARVNDQIITRSEYERAEQQLLDEAKQQNVPESELEDKQRDLLRDMIDQQLLLSKGKELGITGDTEVMRRLDDIRKQNHLDSMEALQKAAEQQGISFEDFKQQIRNSAITSQVVQQEVGAHLNLTHAEEEQYYAEHGKDFEVPEQVHLSEILVTTPENATDAQLNAAQQKADAIEAKLKAGANFADTARANSGGPTAAAGGDLGDFKRGTLGDVLEKATFPLPAGGVTQPIRTRQGFVILRVDSHQAAGIPPLASVEQQVQEAIYMDRLQPALRAYLTKSRDEAYIDIKPGFVDTGAGAHESKPVFTAYAPPPVKKRVLKKERLEQEKAQKAQENLAAAREKLAAKQAAKAGVKATGYTKRHKIRREKIRYGQAPRQSLPAATRQTAENSTGTELQGQTAGAAMAPTDSVTTISTGTGFDESNADPLAPKAGPEHKTRFSDRERESQTKHAQEKLSKAETKASARPVEATEQQTVAEKQQDAPLGLNGDTAKHKKKHKHVKGEAKERLQDEKKPAAPAAPAPTVNPTLGGAPAAQPAQLTPPPSAPAGSAAQQ
ncbi:MAG TPA: peptidylprolyl isomerase [Acidobacteriaceae bacterium]|jgi:peptidyl-prolyl cis-trans isomerase SurA|nr:peptidylprolyl isomerase [Acidobacteriaceae bacterium]